MEAAKSLFSYKPFWAKRLGTAPFLPMSRAEMDALGWDACDIIVVTGDAYVDHASFGMAVIGRVLEAQGFRVGIISQPDWTSADPFRALGRPTLFFGVTAGNMDSMVNRYTSDRKIRKDDAYTPGAEGGRRPDRAVTVYSQRCREAFRDVPIVLGGIEASLRRVAHYDYWSDKVRRSVLLDSKADILLFGNAERALIELAHRLAKGEAISTIRDLRGTAYMVPRVPEGWAVLDASDVDADSGAMPRGPAGVPAVIRLPSYEVVRDDPVQYTHASRVGHLESNPGHARPLVQAHGDREVWLNPPPLPLGTGEMDRVFELPYARAPHPSYGGARIPAWEMIRFSVNVMRGCFGGCSFCSITEHEGKVIQSRSEGSILREIEQIRDKTEGFTGVVSDLGGPTANMWRLNCSDPKIQAVCRRWSCVYPDICKNLETDQTPLVDLYRKARAIQGVKKITIASGLRYDLAVKTPAYVKELVTHHVGGYLKIAPEHTEEGPLALMMKPGMGAYDRFRALFETFSKQAGKQQFLIPYFIAAHPGTTDEDMMNLALWLKRNHFRADQVQTFLPSPMSLATAMYHGERNPLKPVRRDGPVVATAKGLRQRRLHKAFLRYHDPENWPMLREALRQMGRTDLIGMSKKHLIPGHQPTGTGLAGGEGARAGRKNGAQTFLTQQTRQGQGPYDPTRGAPSCPRDAAPGAKPGRGRPRRSTGR
ncbi:YgiQ family radical SAM protein [Rhodospirillum rubrum]|uniref:YgiQ family radical SAM protein n=1 Tax=Rhodospirillum rubrum TaxID=1085 RepID=UPI0019043706|nr:YgiQ family radical SAM protein [Rhodospirillum rubrum]MBK1664559.1 YgiQ family radical SAM protein [Rhodospirillum rubrum]MBK1678456.1 YgiQ family radical SAM protein [Rhodospirillum rubrum]